MLRVIREVAPRWIVGENVAGLISWNGGMVFDEVQADLEAEGYEVTAVVIPAAAVNAPHGRDRVWFVAFKNTNKNGRRSNEWKEESNERQQRNVSARNNERISANYGETGDASDTCKIRFPAKMENEQLERRRFGKSYKRNTWDSFPTVSPICSRNDGLSNRLDSITFPKWRNESIKAGGNAVVPQVVYEIFKAIEKYENKFG